MKATVQYFSVVLFIMSFKVALSFEPVDVIVVFSVTHDSVKAINQLRSWVASVLCDKAFRFQNFKVDILRCPNHNPFQKKV